MMSTRRVSTTIVVLLAVVVSGVFATGCQVPVVALRGHVTAQYVGGDVPGRGIHVAVYSDVSESLVAEALTNGDGDFVFTADEVPDGTYRVRLADSTWWDGTATWADATSGDHECHVAGHARREPQRLQTGSLYGQVRSNVTCERQRHGRRVRQSRPGQSSPRRRQTPSGSSRCRASRHPPLHARLL